MLLNEDIQWLLLEGYLSRLFELDVSRARTKQEIEKWNSVQLFVMNIFANGHLLSLSPAMFHRIGTEFPPAVRQVLGSDERIVDINVPIISLKDKEKISTLFDQIPDEEKSKVYAIYYIIKKNIGA